MQAFSSYELKFSLLSLSELLLGMGKKPPKRLGLFSVWYFIVIARLS
jgi:hypothetical protein